MGNGAFYKERMDENHPNWKLAIKRNGNLYTRPDDFRTPFGRDYTRILHSTAYRRLKHKTQVFFTTKNDHICTRIEHAEIKSLLVLEEQLCLRKIYQKFPGQFGCNYFY